MPSTTLQIPLFQGHTQIQNLQQQSPLQDQKHKTPPIRTETTPH